MNGTGGWPGVSKEYVRTLMFSMRAGSAMARVHVLTKLLGTVLLSLVLVRQMDMVRPDPVGVLILLALAIAPHLVAGTIQWVFRSYLVLIFFMLLTLFLNWLVFNPDPGTHIYWQAQVYPGYIPVGVSVSLAVALVGALVIFRLTRGLFAAVASALALVIVVRALGVDLAWVPVRITFFHPLTVLVSDKNLLVAGTKVGAYAAMVFLTLMLVMTSREFEFVGLLCQCRLPFRASFFVSLALRSLSTATIDYETIAQAQTAKGVGIRERAIWERFRDFAYMAVPLVATMFRRASEMGPTLMARGFGRATRPTPYHETEPLRPMDGLILAACLALVILYYRGFNLTLHLGLGRALIWAPQ